MAVESNIACDGCGKSVPVETVQQTGSRWFRVVPLSKSPGRAIGKPTVLNRDFCGVRCLMSFCQTNFPGDANAF